MKKLIIRTGLVTLACVLSVLMLIWSVMMIFFPQSLVNFSKKTGNLNSAAKYAVTVYNRDDDINNLNQVVVLAIAINNNRMTVKYGEKLIQNKQFEAFCNFKDENAGEFYFASYSQYIYGNYAYALSITGEKEKAFSVCKSTLPRNYPINNVFSYLIRATGGDKEFALKIKNYITELSADEEDEGAISRMNIDKEYLEKIING